jgi:hypothetical protein
MAVHKLDSSYQVTSRAVPETEPRMRRRVNSRSLLITSLICSMLLALTVTRDSLWTDEAFSAYMASLKNLGSVLSTLAHGDSSDLLTSAYYVYLHLWSTVFSQSEVSLRAANMPFVLMFAFGMCWASQRIFRSDILWILAALLPFSWAYAADARPHFALVGWSTVCFVALLGCLESPSRSEQRWLPMITLGSLVAGLAFNMLMILAIAPLLFIVLLYAWREPNSVVYTVWRKALLLFAVPLLLVITYIGWGLSHGVPAQYSKPDVMSVASVVYRFAGLAGYGPNRRFDTPFGPYVPGMILAAGLLALAIAGIVFGGAGSRSSTRFMALSGALMTGLLEVLVLSLVLNQQEDVRHLASLAPILLLTIMAAFGQPAGSRKPLIATASLGILCVVWLYGDITMRFSPEYRSQGEDFRSAVARTIGLQRRLHADVALVADPPAAAYYGLAVEGPSPCFPLVETCHEALAKVEWTKMARASNAVAWSSKEIGEWLEAHATQQRPAVVLISRTRHPMYKDSAWWRFLQSGSPSNRFLSRGLLVQVFD